MGNPKISSGDHLDFGYLTTFLKKFLTIESLNLYWNFLEIFLQNLEPEIKSSQIFMLDNWNLFLKRKFAQIFLLNAFEQNYLIFIYNIYIE